MPARPGQSPIPKNRLQDRLLRQDQDDAGVGQPTTPSITMKSNKMSADKNVFMGQKAVHTNTRNHEMNQAKTSLKDGLSPTKKHGLLGSTSSITEAELPSGALAQIEQLLENNLALLLEYYDANKSRQNKPTPGGSGAQGGGMGVQADSKRVVTSSGIRDDIANLTNAKARDNNTRVDNASAVKPGTGKVINAYSVTNANAKNQGALNNQQAQARLASEADQQAQ